MKAAVICAFNVYRNTGMCTVDRAAKRFFAEFPRMDCRFLTLGAMDRLDDGDPSLKGMYRALQEDEDYPHNYDVIIFWGDFLHSQVYWKKDLTRRLLRHGVVQDADAAEELFYRLLMLEGADEDQQSKVVIFGSTMIEDDTDTVADQRFMSALQRLLTNASFVRLRDPISAARVQHLAGKSAAAGIDPAFLYSWEAEFRPDVLDEERVGFTLGRSVSRHRHVFTMLMWLFGRTAGVPLRWLQWFPPEPGERMLRSVADDVGPQGAQDPDQLLERLRGCTLVVTDVYHVCVNAWAAGVPAICFGRGAGRTASTTSDKKKEVLYGYMFARTRYFFWENLLLPKRRMDRPVSRMLAILRDREGSRAIFRRQQEVARRVYDDLHAHMAKLCNDRETAARSQMTETS